MKATYNKDVLAARSILQQVAREDGVSYEEVYEGFQEMILHGLASTEPDTVQFWSEVKWRARKEVPTPEDLLTHITAMSTSMRMNSYLQSGDFFPERFAGSRFH